MKKDRLVVDKRRFAGGETGTALEKAPGMSLEGQAALAQARPAPEFGLSPVLTADKKQQIEKLFAERKIRPPRGWILIKQVPPAEKAGNILLAQVCQKEEDIGIVVAVGDGTYQNGVLIPPEVTIGDQVVFPPFSGVPRKIGGEEFLAIREDEVLLISAYVPETDSNLD